MITIIDCLIGLLILISQATWMHHFSILGVIPNLVAVWVVYVGFMNGKDKALITGLLIGLIQDILFGRLIGLFGLVYMLIGTMSGILAVDVDHSRLLFPSLIALAATLILGILQLLIFQVIPGQLGFLSGLRWYVLPELLYTAVLSVPIYAIYYGFHILFGRLRRRKVQRRIV